MARGKYSKYTSYALLVIALTCWPYWAYKVIDRTGSWEKILSSDHIPVASIGQFGDSFGLIASLMATLAAGSAIVAFIRQQDDSALQEFDRNFFAMLSLLRNTVASVDFHKKETSEVYKIYDNMKNEEEKWLFLELELPFAPTLAECKGQDAFRAMLSELRFCISSSDNFRDSKKVSAVYQEFYDQRADDIGQYFRTAYNLFRMIEEDCPVSFDHYVRMARAQLSNSEIILLSYNCAVGMGRHKFKNLFEKFQLPHNVHVPESNIFCQREHDFLKSFFPQCKYERDEAGVYTYSDHP